jgi:hypothetical protein
MVGSWDAVDVGLTAALAVISWFFGWTMGKRQRRVALFGKRLPLYEATRRFLSRVLESARVELDWLMELQRETRNRDFLFREEVGEHIDKLYKKGLRLWLLQEKHRMDEVEELIEWFVTQVDETKRVFGKELDVTEN